MKRAPLLVVALVACAPAAPAESVVLPTAPTVAAAASYDCTPTALDPVGVTGDGELDGAALRKTLDDARVFAEQCCTGDAAGDARVVVTVSPEGYATAVAISPEDLASGATGSCLHGSFHRVTTRAFRGDARTIPVAVRIHR